MKNIASIIFAGLLAGSLFHPAGVARADDEDRRDIQNERRDLRQDRQQLEALRHKREAEIREGDYGEARRYSQQIQKLENDMHRDRRELGNRDWDDYRGDHHDRD
jgi:Tfp pilus assembly protein PilF